MTDLKSTANQDNGHRALSAGSGGFTLIELLVAIAVFVGISVLAIPSIQGMVDRMTGDRAAHEFISDLNVAKSLAVRNGIQSQVAFDVPAVGQYTISWVDDNGPRVRVVDMARFRNGIQFEPNPPSLGLNSPVPVGTITFSPQGFTTLAPAGWGNIYITDQDNSEVIRIEVLFSGVISEMRWNANTNQWIYR